MRQLGAALIIMTIALWGTRATAEPKESDQLKPFGTCATDGKGKVPASLDEAMVELERLLGKERLAELKKKDPISYHHGLGTGLRNCWGLWQGGGKLGKWFGEKGIQHPDDMSGIILTSLHRRLNGKPLEVEKQIAYYKDYWKKQREAYEKGTSSGGSIFNLVGFIKGEGWVSVRGENIPRVNDLVVPLKEQAEKAVAACWKKLPPTPGTSAVETSVAISIDRKGRIASSRVVKTAIAASDAACFSRALVGVAVPKHAGTSYTLILQSYRFPPGK